MNLEKIISIVRNLKEDASVGAPNMNLGSGQFAGTREGGDDPPIDLRRKNVKNWNIFFKNLAKMQRKKLSKNT